MSRMLKEKLLMMSFGGVLTLVFGCMMVTPCLLMAIRTMSGKFGSDVC